VLHRHASSAAGRDLFQENSLENLKYPIDPEFDLGRLAGFYFGFCLLDDALI